MLDPPVTNCNFAVYNEHKGGSYIRITEGTEGTLKNVFEIKLTPTMRKNLILALQALPHPKKGKKQSIDEAGK